MGVAAAIAFFSTWLILTVINQFHEKRPAWLRSLDIVGLIPIWTFFAPNPGMTDYHLLYRDILADGTIGFWKEVRLQQRAGPLSAVWSPDRRRNKALTDLVAAAIQHVRSNGQQGIPLSVPYLLLLNYITSRPHSLAASATQFMVLEHGGYQNLPDLSRVLILSGVHRLA